MKTMMFILGFFVCLWFLSVASDNSKSSYKQGKNDGYQQGLRVGEASAYQKAIDYCVEHGCYKRPNFNCKGTMDGQGNCYCPGK